MTLDEADAALAAFRNQSQCATQNLIEMAELPISKRLRGEDGEAAPEFADFSRPKINSALAAADRLWDRIALFNDTIARAQKVRDSIWLVHAEAKLEELRQILRGPSVRLPSPQTPLEQRGLFSAAQAIKSISLNELMTELHRDFDEARSVLLRVDSVWHDGANSLIEFQRAVAAAQAKAASVELERMRAKSAALIERADALKGLMRRDPLAFYDALNGLLPELEKLNASAAKYVHERAAVAEALKKSAELEKDLREIRARNAQVVAECRHRLERSAGLIEPLSEKTLDDLRQWLMKLAAQFRTDFRPLPVALAKFRETAEAHLKSERAALEANARPLQAWSELNGRLMALKSKARALASRGTVLDPSLERLAAEADKHLNSQPAAMENAEKLVRAYEAKLAGRG